MEVIGKFILNLIADGIATLIHDIFVALLTVIMDFVSKMIVSLWDDSIISAIVSCSSLAPQEQDTTSENDYLEIKLLSTESLRQALGSAPARPHAPSAATREPRRKLGASRREAAALYPGKFNP